MSKPVKPTNAEENWLNTWRKQQAEKEEAELKVKEPTKPGK